jgi:Xaa-Pro aminopeptidase
MTRASADASAAGLAGLVIAPGPDLEYLTGYRPTAITERLTALVLTTGREPALVVPRLERLAAAGGAADAAYRRILEVEFAGRRECDVAADLSALLIQYGHSHVDFTVVGSGPNGANPHHEAGERTIQEGDMVVLDFGGLKDGYGSDTTRTVHVGEPTAEEREVFEIVRRAQQAGFEAVRPGVPCEDIDRAARKVISDAGYGDRFIHRVGHGIGITTHEPPYMVEGEERLIEPGMCFSIEPGIYLSGRFGVRIEDIVVATEDGGRRLNNTSHDMHIVA